MKTLVSVTGALVLFLSLGASASNNKDPRDPNMNFLGKTYIHGETCSNKSAVGMGDAASVARAEKIKENSTKSGSQR